MTNARLQNPEQHDIAGWSRRAAELDSEIERLRAAIVWMGSNWSADAPDDGDRSNIPENIRDLIPAICKSP